MECKLLQIYCFWFHLKFDPEFSYICTESYCKFIVSCTREIDNASLSEDYETLLKMVDNPDNFLEVKPLGEDNGEFLANFIDVELAKRGLFSLGLARRAGKIVVGFEQVRSALKKMSVNRGLDKSVFVKSAILITAKDASSDGQNKLKALADRLGESGANIKKFVLFV